MTPSDNSLRHPARASRHPRLALSLLSLLSIPGLGFTALAGEGRIDREALVSRHNVHVASVDPESPLSVGNGDFAFTVDATGLQSMGALYHREGIPLETMSTWAWHSFPNTENLALEDAMKPYPFHGRTIQYAGLQHSPAGAYFRENPHPIPLGQIGFVYKGRAIEASDITDVDQTLDLWTGVVSSSFSLGGKTVRVETMAHADRSLVAVSVDSPLLEDGSLAVRFRFPYSYDLPSKNKPPFVWDAERHRTSVIRSEGNTRLLERALDDDRYCVKLSWAGDAAFSESAAHDFRLQARDSGRIAFTCEFLPGADASPAASVASVGQSSIDGWKHYWTAGGAIDLSASRDPRAAELERRIVLSQYLVRVNYAGSFPPSESGLTNITWYGKHNSEMYFWHAAQFYQWGHVELLEKGLGWYIDILPKGMADAAEKGFEGVRWPKMAGIDGRPSPGTINPFIIWNQPNPIYLSELVHRAKPERETLDRYREVVFESAKFLASFAVYDEATKRYVLGPPIKNVSESTGENLTQNPAFELAYWHYGLKVAQAWRERLGLEREPHWDDILAKLSRLPESDGKYLEIETFPDMYEKSDGVPTSMLMALGFLPETEMVDLETARRTFHEVNRRSPVGVKRWVSWAYGQGALTAARLGEPQTAVDILCNDAPASRFMNNGHVRRPKEPRGVPAYLPVNAALLTAVGLMAGGWDGAPDVNAPGFPQDGSWTVKSEGLHPMP